jgi:hypothetical protein
VNEDQRGWHSSGFLFVPFVLFCKRAIIRLRLCRAGLGSGQAGGRP